ncbi:hypothetical protein EUGRSUZ_L00998 [Eucalyptus grandis]|uniref:Uncharacterized protein n=1 Tax=Eucalyptus grandis TaxID=71139 RepID=A0A058ZU42_EUCGR|nr:hypothetical protein EUGRSUZ_L00998 [Eucalyptus grandis]
MSIEDDDAWRIVHVPGRPPIPTDQQLTVNAVAAQIQQPKLTNTIMRRLSQIAPLEDLHHVKRVNKKCLEGGLQICCIVKGRVGRTVQAMAHLIPSSKPRHFCWFRVFASAVQMSLMLMLSQLKEQVKSSNISGITGFSDEDSQSVVSFMKYALELAKSHGNMVVNAAVIVDPLSNQVIARACDEVCSRQTPKTEVGESKLRHPFLVYVHDGG